MVALSLRLIIAKLRGTWLYCCLAEGILFTWPWFISPASDNSLTWNGDLLPDIHRFYVPRQLLQGAVQDLSTGMLMVLSQLPLAPLLGISSASKFSLDIPVHLEHINSFLQGQLRSNDGV